jgi:hypothetical protein
MGLGLDPQGDQPSGVSQRMLAKFLLHNSLVLDDLCCTDWCKRLGVGRPTSLPGWCSSSTCVSIEKSIVRPVALAQDRTLPDPQRHTRERRELSESRPELSEEACQNRIMEGRRRWGRRGGGGAGGRAGGTRRR